MESLPKFDWSSLVWYSLRLELVPHHDIGFDVRYPTFPKLHALLKNVPATSSDGQLVKRAFHVPEVLAHCFRCRAEQGFPLEILFFGGDDEIPARWLEAFSVYLKSAPQRAKFTLLSEQSFVRHDASEYCRTELAAISHAELDFLSPLPFVHRAGGLRTGISLETFLSSLQRRVEKLFGVAPSLPPTDGLTLQTLYWDYREMSHASKSQPGHRQLYNGCVGPLYFRGNLEPVLPWLRLAEALHAGGKAELNGLGYCRLHMPARPLYNTILSSSGIWREALSYIQKSHDDWATGLASEQGMPIDADQFCQALGEALASPAWHPEPATAFDIPKREGKRRLEKLPLSGLVIHTGLHELLREPIDRLLTPVAFGYRRGRSVQAASARLRALIEQGYRYILEADIDNFFPSILLERLEQLLDDTLPPADVLLRRVLAELLRTPYLEKGEVNQRSRGLMQGSPLSPLLANLYLAHFDAALSSGQAQLVRYADDFVMLTRHREQAENMLTKAQAELADAGLTLNPDKTTIRNIDAGFRFLGQPFGAGLPNDTIVDLAARPFRKTLYLTEPGCFLGHNGGALEIRQAGQLHDILPLRRIAQIIVMARTSFSSGLVRQCATFGIPILFTTGRNGAAGLTATSRRQYRVSERQTLHYAELSDTARLALAKAFATRKIDNYTPLISARYHAGDNQLLSRLEEAQEAIAQAANVAEVRGYEGVAAHAIFTAYNGYIRVPAFNFAQRIREHPDRMNSLFNFGYHLLFLRLNVLLRGAGLNPYLGFLHDGDNDYESLVCDFEELFRAPVDRFLLSLVNLKIIQADDFQQTSESMRLTQEAVKRFILRFEDMLQTDAGGISLARAMELQIEAFRRYVEEDRPLWLFLYKPVPTARQYDKREA